MTIIDERRLAEIEDRSRYCHVWGCLDRDIWASAEDVPDLIAAVRERDARIKQLEIELRESKEQDAVGRRLLAKATDTINDLELQLAEAKG